MIKSIQFLFRKLEKLLIKKSYSHKKWLNDRIQETFAFCFTVKQQSNYL